MPYLGTNGWQYTIEDLTQVSQEATEAGVRLCVGPAVVNHIPEYERITVHIPDVNCCTCSNASS